MKLKIELSEEVVFLLNSIDSSLRIIASREPSSTKPITTSDKDVAKEDRLTVSTDDYLVKMEVIDALRAQGVQIEDSDFDI